MQNRQLGCLETLVLAMGIFLFFGGASALATLFVTSLFVPLFAEFSTKTINIPVPIFYLSLAAFGFAILIAAGVISDYRKYLRERKSKDEKS